jgi:two-component system, sensor histidine kinase LadS
MKHHRSLNWTPLFFLFLAIVAGYTALRLIAAPGIAATNAMHYWLDTTGQASIDSVIALPEGDLKPMAGTKAMQLSRNQALWLRYKLPETSAQERWLIKLEGPPFTNRISLHQQQSNGAWAVQNAGDHLPNTEWTKPDLSPVFNLDPQAARTVWLRVEEFPSPSRPALCLVRESEHQARQIRSLVLVGAYFGFCVLVMYLGWVYWRMYRDPVFVGYVIYVACMMGLQACFTGLGQALLWPRAGPANDVIIAFFANWVVASGLWFVTKVCSFARYSRVVYRFMQAWCLFGLIFPFYYANHISPATLAMVNLYGLISVLASIGLCIWAWRRGELYGLVTVLAFLPLHLAYVFPSLRLAGVISDGPMTQYAFMLGSAIEIPALLYVLHRRALEYTENAARVKALRSTDALTGLPFLPVAELRQSDALRRNQRHGHQSALCLVDLSNYDEIVAKAGLQAGERALVMTAAHLRSIVRDIDTVCRVEQTRFVVFMEPPASAEQLNAVAQSMVAKGLGPDEPQAGGISLHYRVCTLMQPDLSGKLPEVNSMQMDQLLALMHQTLDRAPADQGRRIIRLPFADEPPDAKRRADLVQAMNVIEDEIRGH